MKYTDLFLPFIVTVACSSLLVPSVSNAQQSPDHDTSYFVTYPGTFVGRFYFSKKYTSFTLPALDNSEDATYSANTLLTMGIGATYNNLTLNLAYRFEFLNNSDNNKGETKSIDLQAHFFPRKWALDLLAIRHKGSYLEKKGYAAGDPDSYYYRPDTKQIFFGFSGYRVLNPDRFSFNAAMMQNEWQKKSAGSLLLGGLVYYGQVKGDSSLIPSKIEQSFPQAADINNINYFGIGIGGGYAYSLVILKHFFMTASAVANVGVNFSSLEISDDKRSRTVINPCLIYKAAVGYNSDSWGICATWAANDLWVKGNCFDDNFRIPTGNYRVILSKKIALKKH